MQARLQITIASLFMLRLAIISSHACVMQACHPARLVDYPCIVYHIANIPLSPIRPDPFPQCSFVMRLEMFAHEQTHIRPWPNARLPVIELKSMYARDQAGDVRC